MSPSGDSIDHGNGQKQLSLLLSTEMKIVPSYLTWMEELADHLEDVLAMKTDSLESYIKTLWDDEKKVDLEREEKRISSDGEEVEEERDWEDPVAAIHDGEKCQLPHSIEFVAKKLNKAAMHAYVGQFNLANDYLNHLEKGRLEKMDPSHMKVIEYCRDSLEWSMRVLQGNQGDDKGLLIQEESEKLIARWNDEIKAGDSQVKVILVVLKAHLCLAMKLPEKVSLDFYNEAMELDPQCSIWRHKAYRITRIIRTKLQRGIQGGMPGPSEQETQLAKSVYELCPNDFVSIQDYALSLKEKFWLTDREFWNENEDEYLQCVELFKKALCLALEANNRYWVRKIKIYLAEFFCFGKGRLLDRLEGKRLFDECEQEYPRSSTVFHKVGKLYHRGLNGKKFQDLMRAKDCYKRAIDIKPENFPCFMDYVKLLWQLGNHDELISVIETALNKATRDHEVAKLKTLIGFYTWILPHKNIAEPKSEAIKHWIWVLRNLPRYTKDVYNMIRNPPCDGKTFSAANIKGVRIEIIHHLKLVRSNLAEEDLKVVDTFIEELEKPNARENRHQQNQNHQRPGNEGRSYDIRGNQNHYQSRYRKSSEADLDNDWRKK